MQQKWLENLRFFYQFGSTTAVDSCTALHAHCTRCATLCVCTACAAYYVRSALPLGRLVLVPVLRSGTLAVPAALDLRSTSGVRSREQLHMCVVHVLQPKLHC
jgi:hypothetical protein